MNRWNYRAAFARSRCGCPCAITGCARSRAAQLAALVRAAPDLELLAPVELSAVCFRYAARREERDLNALNREILKRIVDNGRVYLSNAAIRGDFALRACFVNHRTQAQDVALIIAEVLTAARDAVKLTPVFDK